MTRSTANNLALQWFLSYGSKQDLDKRTIHNVTEKGFVDFAKSQATEKEKAFIDECVKMLALEQVDV